MNIIKNIDTKGDRLYLTLDMDGLKEIELKLFAPYPKIAILSLIEDAVNHKTLESSSYKDEEENEIEKFIHESLVNNIVDFFKKHNLPKVQVTGVYDKEQTVKFKLTELGKKGFISYFQENVMVLDWTLSMGISREEAFYRIIDETLSVKNHKWNGKKKKNSLEEITDKEIVYTVTTEEVDETLGGNMLTGNKKEISSEFLVSIDTIEEFLKYKTLSQECVKLLFQAGMIEDCENNDHCREIIKSTPKKESYNLVDYSKVVEDPALKSALDIKN